MELNSNEIADKAKMFGGKAGQLLSKVDTEKAGHAIDSFNAKVFAFGKVFSAIFMFLSILAIVGSLIYCVFAGPKGLTVPDYEAYSKTVKSKTVTKSGKNSAVKSVKEVNAIRNKYEDDITDLMDICDFPKEAFEDIVQVLCDMEATYRTDYIEGAVDFAKANAKDSKKDEFNGGETFATYNLLFELAREEVETSKEISKANRSAALNFCGFAFIGLILFLIIPLLLQIEVNTRSK